MDAYHTLVAGDSGSGKTTLLREMHDSYPGLSIWVAHKSPGGISGNDLDDATTVRSEAEAREASATRLRWVCDDPEDVLDAARRVALDYREATGYPSQVILDEAQVVLNDELDSSHPAKKMLHEDRDQALKFTLGTQDPTDLQPNYTALKQCAYFIFVGIPSPFHRGFADYFSLPKDEMPAEKYHYVTFAKTQPFEWEAVALDETKEVYG